MKKRKQEPQSPWTYPIHIRQYEPRLMRQVRRTVKPPTPAGFEPTGRERLREVVDVIWGWLKALFTKEAPAENPRVAKAVAKLEKALDVWNESVDVLVELADILEELDKKALATKCRGVSTAMRIAVGGLEGLIESVKA